MLSNDFQVVDCSSFFYIDVCTFKCIKIQNNNVYTMSSSINQKIDYYQFKSLSLIILKLLCVCVCVCVCVGGGGGVVCRYRTNLVFYSQWLDDSIHLSDLRSIGPFSIIGLSDPFQ